MVPQNMFWEISKALDRRLTFFIFVYFLWVVSRRPEKIGVMKLTSISCDYLWNLAFHDMNGGQSFTSQRRRHLYNSCVLSSSRESVAARICWIRDEPESPLFADCPVLFTLLTLSLFWSAAVKYKKKIDRHIIIAFFKSANSQDSKDSQRGVNSIGHFL